MCMYVCVRMLVCMYVCMYVHLCGCEFMDMCGYVCTLRQVMEKKMKGGAGGEVEHRLLQVGGWAGGVRGVDG